jgi:hypothetical protein
MESIYAIIISDFSEKIHFLHKRVPFDYENCLKIVQSLNHSLSQKYLKEFVSSGLDMRFMDTMINPKLKMKISIIGEVLIQVLYDSNVDIRILNIINNALLEGIFSLAKTKRIKIDLLNRRFNEVNLLLEDTLYFFDSRIRVNSKNGLINMKEVFNVSR